MRHPREPNLGMASLLIALIGVAQPSSGAGQQASAAPGSPSATTTISGKQLPAPDPPFGGVIKDDALQSKPWWAPRIVPPKQAPNVLLIITDDAGFGVPSTFGGVIPTPTMDRIANEGLRYNRMFSTALCSPTRAALITGRNHHSAGFGVISEQSTGFPGYNSIIDKDKATIGRVLLDNGYSTVVVRQGPQHAGVRGQPGRALRPVADRHGLRVLLRLRRRRRQPVAAEPVPQHDADLSLRRVSRAGTWSPAMADDAIDWMTRMHQTDPEQADLHQVRARRHACAAPPDQGMGGQDQRDAPLRRRLREAARAHLREPEEARRDPQDAKLAPWPDDVLKPWDQLSAEEQKLFIRQVEVFAAYAAYSDHEIGRVIQAFEDLGKLDNTLIIYINGDNGTSAEGGPLGTPNEVAFFNGVNMMPVAEQMKFYDVWGTEQTYNHMSAGWSWAFDTPFDWFKQNASRLGGINQNMVVSWPARIKDKGGLREQFVHVIDVMPTILEAAGIPAPEMVDGIKQAPIEGTSFAYTFDEANAKDAVAPHDPVLRDDGPVGAL